MASECMSVGGEFGPADGFGDEHDGVLAFGVAEVTVEGGNEVGVFAEGVGIEASDFDDDVTTEETERTGDDEQSADA